MLAEQHGRYYHLRSMQDGRMGDTTQLPTRVNAAYEQPRDALVDATAPALQP